MGRCYGASKMKQLRALRYMCGLWRSWRLLWTPPGVKGAKHSASIPNLAILQSVQLFSKLNHLFFDTNIEKNIILDNKNKKKSGWPNRCFCFKKSTDRSVRWACTQSSICVECATRSKLSPLLRKWWNVRSVHVFHGATRGASVAVKFFSNFNKLFFGYFHPIKIFFDIKFEEFFGVI